MVLLGTVFELTCSPMLFAAVGRSNWKGGSCGVACFERIKHEIFPMFLSCTFCGSVWRILFHLVEASEK